MANQPVSPAGDLGLELCDRLTPSPPLVTDEAVHIKGGSLFQHEVGGAAELGGQHARGLSLRVLFAESLEIVVAWGIVFEEADGGFTEGPLDVGVADLGTGEAERLSIGFLGAFDEPAVGREVLGRGEAGDIADLIEKGEAQDLSDTVDTHEEAESIGVVDSGELKDGALELGDKVVVVVEGGEVGPDGGLDGWMVEELGEAFAVRGLGQWTERSSPMPLLYCSLPAVLPNLRRIRRSGRKFWGAGPEGRCFHTRGRIPRSCTSRSNRIALSPSP